MTDYTDYLPLRLAQKWQIAIRHGNWFVLHSFIDGMIYALSIDAPEEYLDNLMLLRSIANLNAIKEQQHDRPH